MPQTIPKGLADYFDRSSIALCAARIGPGGDHPLVAANAAFLKLTGYQLGEIVERDCRFLQGPRTHEQDRAVMRRFLDDEKVDQIRATILNYSKEGAPFVNLVFMVKLRDLQRRTQWIFASQFDISRGDAESLDAYDRRLSEATQAVQPIADQHDMAMNGSLLALGNAAAVIAQAKMKMAQAG